MINRVARALAALLLVLGVAGATAPTVRGAAPAVDHQVSP